MAYRLHHLCVISDWHYRELFKQIARLGYRKNEPEAGPHETSQILHRVFSTLKQERIGKNDIASEIHVSCKEIDELVFGLILNEVKSNNLSKPSATVTLPHKTASFKSRISGMILTLRKGVMT